MSTKQPSPGLKMALEYGPIILFFVGYVFLKDRVFTVGGTEYTGFIAMTALFIPLLALSTLALWRLTGHISKMQIVTLVLVVGFGGLSIWFNDERFFKMKPTMIYLLFAGILGFGLMRGQSYLESVMDAALPLQREGWMILTKRLALFFLFLAVANEAIWRTMSTDAWVNFKTFGLTLGTFGFFMSQAKLFAKFGIPEDAPKD
ncbi:inner membrane-spanning protein YciB [Aliiroseovarius subalbicans]|uniref:inner membrane-spanning protein YciB n=1 Tax=Aliiroseovarius subalbicans TaxID=2925840 RepID=UPI001F564C1D|nr:inner membrane-spanning protein YciB [Aliiroseovarius subalbicans]MCI2399328.1 septation protein IspZ [Aliiroseovarius subalbicans]